MYAHTTILLRHVPLRYVRLQRFQLSTHSSSDEDSSTKPSFRAKLSALWATAKAYGPLFTVYYTGVWLATGFAIYGTLESTSPTLALDLVHKLNLQDSVGALLAKLSPEHVNVATAIAINEIIEPVRLPIGVVSFLYLHKKFASKTKSTM